MILFYDLMVAAISLILCCLPAVIIVLIIEAFLKKTSEVSISVITFCAVALSLYIGYLIQASSFQCFLIALLSGSLSILILRNKYSKVPAGEDQTLSSNEDEPEPLDHMSLNPDSESSTESNHIVKPSTTIYKVIIGIFCVCLLVVIIYVQHIKSEYSNRFSEVQTESYEKGFEEGFYAGYDEAYADQISAKSEKNTEKIESNYGYISPDSVEQESEMISSGDYVYWNGTGYYHNNKSCSRAEDAKIYLRSQLDSTSIKPCGLCYQ